VPRLSILSIDRAADKVRIGASARRPVTLNVHRCGLVGGFSVDQCPRKRQLTATSGAGGKLTFDTTSAIDLRGFDIVEAIMKSSAGDRFHAGSYVPVFFVDPGSPSIGGNFGHRAVVKFQLLDHPGGMVIAAAALPSAHPYGAFNDGVSDVLVQPGDLVIGDFSADARLTVPPLITTVNTATDQVTAKCFQNRPYAMITEIPSGGPFRGTAGANGLIQRILGVNLTSASSISIQCLSAAGDGVAETFDVN
jgi:hypothetical protein